MTATANVSMSSQEACMLQFLMLAFHSTPPVETGVLFVLQKCYSNIFQDESSCSAQFDAVLCWPQTPINTTVHLDCPNDYINGMQYHTERI
jgi:hypothetical protein